MRQFVFLCIFLFALHLCVAAPNWANLPKGSWRKVAAGLPSSYRPWCFWTANKEAFITLSNTPWTLNTTTNISSNVDGVYQLGLDFVWRRVSSAVVCAQCDKVNPPFPCYVALYERPARFLPTSNWNGSFEFLGEKSPYFNANEFKYSDDSLYAMDADKVGRVQFFNLTTRTWNWVGGQEANPVPNIRGGAEFMFPLADNSVYISSRFMRTVWRYSGPLNAWLNVTFDLDMRNQFGRCCGEIGPLYVSDDNKDIYMATGRGLFWFRGTRWQKVLDGTREFAKIGNYLFAKEARYDLPGPVAGIPLKSFDGLPNFPTTMQNMHFGRGIESPTGDGEVIMALPLVHFTAVEGQNMSAFVQSVEEFYDGPYFLRFSTPGDPDYALIDRTSTNFEVRMASYLGSDGEDNPVAAQILQIDGHKCVVIATNIAGSPPPYLTAPIQNIAFANDSSTGYVIALKMSDLTAVKVLRVAVSIRSMKIVRGLTFTRLVLGTPDGVVVLDAATLNQQRLLSANGELGWSLASMDTSERIAVVINNANISLYGADNTLLGSRRYPGSGINDIEMSEAIDPVVYIGGFSQLASGATTGYQRPNLHVWSTHPSTPLENSWCLWCTLSLAEIQAQDLMADSRVSEMELSADGRTLFMIGLSAGGNTVFLRDSNNLNRSAPILSFDEYTAAYQLQGAPHILYYARIDVASRRIERSQLRITRLPSGYGNTLDPTRASFTVGPKGDLYIAGRSACCIPNRDGDLDNRNTILRVNCRRAGPYNGGDAYILHMNANFTVTTFWTTLNSGSGTNSGGGRDGVAVAIDAEDAVALFRAAAGNLTVTDNAPQKSNINGSDVYIAIWSHRQDSQNCTAEFLQDVLPYVDPDTTYRAPVLMPAPLVENLSQSSVNSGAIAAAVIVSLIVVAAIVAAVVFRKRLPSVLKKARKLIRA